MGLLGRGSREARGVHKRRRLRPSSIAQRLGVPVVAGDDDDDVVPNFFQSSPAGSAASLRERQQQQQQVEGGQDKDQQDDEEVTMTLREKNRRQVGKDPGKGKGKGKDSENVQVFSKATSYPKVAMSSHVQGPIIRRSLR